MKMNTLSILTIICVALLFYILFVQKGSDSSYIVSSVIALIIVALTFLNTKKYTEKNK